MGGAEGEGLAAGGRVYLAERGAAGWHARERVVPEDVAGRRQGHSAGQLHGPACDTGVHGGPDAGAKEVDEHQPADGADAAAAGATAGVAPLLTRVLVAQMIPLLPPMVVRAVLPHGSGGSGALSLCDARDDWRRDQG